MAAEKFNNNESLANVRAKLNTNADEINKKADVTEIENKVDKTTTIAGKALSGNITLAKADVGLGNVDNTPDLAKPVSTAAQTAIDGVAAQKVDKVAGKSLMADTEILRLSTVVNQNIENKVDKSTTISGKPLTANITLAKADVGLGSVDNTPDLAKPVSTATQAAIETAISSLGISPAVNSVNQFTIANSYAQDTNFIFRYGVELIALTTKAVPDGSGTQIFTGPYTPSPAVHLLPQFQANAKFSRDFNITTSGTNILVFTAKQPGSEYDFIAGNAGTNTVQGKIGGATNPISDTEKNLLAEALKPVYRPPFAKLTTTFTDQFLKSGELIVAPITMTYHREDAGDFEVAKVYVGGWWEADIFPDTTADETMIGFATLAGGTTGGAGGETVTVRSLAELQAAVVNDDTPRIVLIDGVFVGTGITYVSSNKTIIGLPGSKLIGISLSIYDRSNVIIRYLTSEKVVGFTNIIIKEDSHHVWVDHCHFSSDRDHGWEYYDGLLDIGTRSNYVTVSNCIFKDNPVAFLIGFDYTNPEDIGFLKTTIYNCYFQNISQRAPKVSWAQVHVFNCHFNNGGYAVGSNVDADVKVENNYFEHFETPISTMVTGGDGYVWGVATNYFDTETCGPNNLTTAERDWVIPYDYTLIPAPAVPAMVALKAGPSGRETQYGQPYTVTTMPYLDEQEIVVVFQYKAGAVKQDIFGRAYPEGRILASTVATETLKFKAKYRIWYGPLNYRPVNPGHVVDLPFERYSGDGDVFTFETGTIESDFYFVVPPDKVLVSVIDLDSNTDITKQYVVLNDNFMVDNIAGADIWGYKLLGKEQDMPYHTSRRHQITLKNK